MQKEEFEQLKREAEARGYKTVLEYLKSEGSNWKFDPETYLTELHKNYIDACSLGQKKAFSTERWNPVTDTFKDFLEESLQVIEVRKKEVKKKRKLASKPFPGLYESNLIEDLDDRNPELEIEVDNEELDMYDEILELSRKAIISFLNGEFNLYEKNKGGII